MTAMTDKKEINEECARLFELLLFYWKKCSLGEKALCDEVFDVLDDDEFYSEDEREAAKAKHYDRYKKIFQRKQWEKNQATKATLINLEKLTKAFRRTLSYEKIEGEAGVLPLECRIEIKKISAEYDRKSRYAPDDEE